MLTRFGHSLLLGSAFRGPPPRLQAALCDCTFLPDLLVSQLNEPALTNGYERKELVPGTVDWPTLSSLNGEAYIESRAIPWAASGAGYSKAIRRAALLTQDGTQVVALMSALVDPLIIKPDTPAIKRTFRFRIYTGQ